MTYPANHGDWKTMIFTLQAIQKNTGYPIIDENNEETSIEKIKDQVDKLVNVAHKMILDFSIKGEADLRLRCIFGSVFIGESIVLKYSTPLRLRDFLHSLMWETGAYIAQPLVLTAKTGEKIIVWTLSSDLETVLPEASYIPTQYLGDGSPDEDAFHLINFFDSQEKKGLGNYFFDEVMSTIEDKVLKKTDARNQIVKVDTTTMRKVAKQLKEIDLEALAKTSN